MVLIGIDMPEVERSLSVCVDRGKRGRTCIRYRHELVQDAECFSEEAGFAYQRAIREAEVAYLEEDASYGIAYQRGFIAVPVEDDDLILGGRVEYRENDESYGPIKVDPVTGEYLLPHAYVWLDIEREGASRPLLLNEWLVRQGFARASGMPEAKYAERIQRAEAEAKRARVGLWAACPS